MSITLMDVQESIAKQLENSEWFKFDGTNTRHDIDLAHAVVGLNEEAGEVGGLLKKQVFRGKHKTQDQWTSELGDVLWYLVATATLMGINMEDIWRYNCGKLEERRRAGVKGKDTWEG